MVGWLYRPSHQFRTITENLTRSFKQRRRRAFMAARTIAYEWFSSGNCGKTQIVIVEVFAVGDNNLNGVAEHRSVCIDDGGGRVHSLELRNHIRNMFGTRILVSLYKIELGS